MQWQDEAILLSARPYGETAYVVQLFTPAHGRHAGLIKGRKKHASLMQQGNRLRAEWKARLSEHLGNFSLEMIEPYAARLMQTEPKLNALLSACALIETSLPERDPHPELYHALLSLLEALAEKPDWAQHYVRFEQALLTELGYGLDLSECAATGRTENLMYISPKSGRAVSAEAGQPYHDKLFKLPAFLLSPHQHAGEAEIAEGFRLTGYFLEKYRENVAHRPLPAIRQRLAFSLTEA